MPALTKEELDARKRARNSRIMEQSLDRMAIVQETTVDRVNMPEEYYRRKNTGSQQVQDQNASEDAPGQTSSLPLNSLPFSGLLDSMKALDSLPPELKQAMESGDPATMMSSLQKMLQGITGGATSPQKNPKVRTASFFIMLMLFTLTAFSALTKFCIAHYAGSETTRWIARNTVVPIFMFFHTIKELDGVATMKFKMGIFQLLILAFTAYYSIIRKAYGVGLIPFVQITVRGVASMVLLHIVIYIMLWFFVYIGDRAL